MLLFHNNEIKIFVLLFPGRCGHGSACEQLCYELHDGMYECDCRHGYELHKDGYSCSGKFIRRTALKPLLIFLILHLHTDILM